MKAAESAAEDYKKFKRIHMQILKYSFDCEPPCGD
jgi:hypothetical protein